MYTTQINSLDESGILLNEIVSVRQRFLRSVNLAQDFYTTNPLDGYLLTTSGLAALERIAEGFHHTYARAFSITGSYGSGKSAFALFASKVLSIGSQSYNSPRARVFAQLPELRELLPELDTEGFLPILITGSRASVARILLSGLLNSLGKSTLSGALKMVKMLKRDFQTIVESDFPTSNDVMKVFITAAEMSQKAISGCRGLLVVVDEMGKFLENAAIYPEQGDLQLFQELAEHASRSETSPMMLITILHQAFEEYASRMSAIQRREWQKVQGRFIDIPFADGADETVRLIGQAIVHRETVTKPIRLQNSIEENLQWCRELKLFPPSLSAGEFRELLRNTYPLHPITLLLLPQAFRRFGQSERSLFSFLSSDEPGGFQEFLRTNSVTDQSAPMLRPDHLYDYIVQSLSTSIYAHATAKLWSEAEESVYRLRDRNPLQTRIVKTIALLHILGEQSNLLPSNQVLQFALSDWDVQPQEIDSALYELKTATLIVYRQFKQAYRLYEGSDVDIEARLKDARSHFAQGTDSVQVAARLEVSAPIVARQHSYRTGTLRIFEVRHCRLETLESEIQVGRGQADGAMILCLVTDMDELASVDRIATLLLPSHPEILLGASVETDALNEAAVAVDSLLWVQSETRELINDRVASREVRERLNEATNAFREEWDRLLRPQGMADEGGVWYHHGKPVIVDSPRQLQHLVSQACDAAYPLTPIIQNELINRRQLSSTAAAARRNLIEAMLHRRHEQRLGIEGFPPEASMYVSVLSDTGIHRADGELCDILPPRQDKDYALAQVWNKIEAFLFSEDLDARILTVLNTQLRDCPYGLTEGIMPVLICAALLYHEKEVALYEDGRFVTELDAATFERMMKRPADFKLRGCRIVGERQAVLDRFARGLLTDGEEPTLMNVVRKLYREFNRLPDYTTRTKTMSTSSNSLRDIFKESREPEHLLFIDLPELLGFHRFGEGEPDSANISGFFDRWNETMSEVMIAYDSLLSEIEIQLCHSFEVANWEELLERSSDVIAYITEPKLTGFAIRASDRSLTRKKWLESVAAGVMGRPPYSWNDRDLARFAAQLPALAAAFQHSELLHFEKQKHRVSDKQTAVRLAVTQESGEETARVVIISKEDDAKIKLLTEQLRAIFEGILKHEKQEIRLAVLANMTQEMLNGIQNE